MHEARAAVAALARRTPYALGSHEEERAVDRFVEPGGWDRAHSTLRERHMVLLAAAPGSGVRTAAVCLLRAAESVTGPIRVLPVQQEEEGFLDDRDVVEGGRLLLDLTRVGAEQLGIFRGLLGSFRDTVCKRRAALVVLLPGEGHDHDLADEPVPLTRPDGIAVLRKHLAAHGVEYGDNELRQPALLALLGRVPMRDIARLALLVRDQWHPSDAVSLDTWVIDAARADTTRAEAVRTQVDQQPVHGRTLLLAAALFEGASADAVFEAEQRLVAALGVPVGGEHPFAGPDLRTRLDAIGVTIEPDGRVAFRSPNDAEAVRRHFWRYFPGQRGLLRDWVIACGRALRDGDDEGHVVVDRYVDACLQVGGVQDVVVAIGAWASQRPQRVAFSLTALIRGLTDPRDGWSFRRASYLWAIEHGLPASQAVVVIVGCVNAIATTHPQQAIVRLHHLARHRDDDVAATARSELGKLADDRWILRRLLARLADPTYTNLRDERDRSLFLTTVAPGRLLAAAGGGRPMLAEAGVRSALVHGWAAVLRFGPNAEYEGAVGRWLEAATVSRGGDVVAILVDACQGDFAASAALTGTAERWWRSVSDGPGAEARRRTVRVLVQAVDATAQFRTPRSNRLDEGQT